ncbi:hypothetical protein [Bacteroides congonensis]|uniref:hypothetical protein n=1 Tax=Bacteroides congonensis TaxID=1871006 RepID=UPI002676BD5A|nr:hypothetical protein [Bacteroides congonensis]
MSKMTEEVTRAIATKFLDGDKDFELIKEENYKNYVVYFAAYKLASGNSYNGLPIYVLIDKLGKARFATSEERDEIWHRNDPELEDGEDEDVEYIELPGLCNGRNTLLDGKED